MDLIDAASFLKSMAPTVLITVLLKALAKQLSYLLAKGMTSAGGSSA